MQPAETAEHEVAFLARVLPLPKHRTGVEISLGEPWVPPAF